MAAIIKGDRAITADTALRLSQYFGTTADMWMNMQIRYDLKLATRTTWPKIKPRIRTYKAASSA